MPAEPRSRLDWDAQACHGNKRPPPAAGVGKGSPAKARPDPDAPISQRRGDGRPRPTPSLLAARTRSTRSTANCWRCSTAAPARQEVGELKKREGSGGVPPEREAQVIDGLRPSTRPAAPDERGADLARDHVGLPRAGTPTRVAYLGPAGTFSEEAALGFFGSSIVKVPCATIDEVLRNATPARPTSASCRWRTPTEGVVARSLDLFLTTPCSSSARPACWCATTCCAARTRSRASRRRLRASAGAGAMPAGCRTHLPRPKAPPVASNAEGARLAGAMPRSPPSPARAGGEFGLHVVAPAIQDEAFTTARALPSRPPDRRRPGLGPRLHQPDRLGAEPARCGARHPGAAEEPRRVDDALRVAPGALGPVGVLLLHRPQGHPDQPNVAGAELRSCAACAPSQDCWGPPLDVH